MPTICGKCGKYHEPGLKCPDSVMSGGRVGG